MKILLGISLSKKNYKFLDRFLDSVKMWKVPNNYHVKFVFIVEKKNLKFSKNINNQLKKKNFCILSVNKPGIPQSRNVFLKFIKNNKSKYVGFLDDDCIVSKKWLINMIKFIQKTKCDIVGGPQLHKVKNRFYLKLFNLIEPNKKHGQEIDWIATNNSFIKSEILKDKRILFDEKLKDIGGSDQLFFKKLHQLNFECRWNRTSEVIENIQPERENILWFIKRNLRYGYSGNYIDRSIYGGPLNQIFH